MAIVIAILVPATVVLFIGLLCLTCLLRNLEARVWELEKRSVVPLPVVEEPTGQAWPRKVIVLSFGDVIAFPDGDLSEVRGATDDDGKTRVAYLVSLCEPNLGRVSE